MSFSPVDPNESGLILYYSPGACSRVTITALEEAKAEYTLRKVSLPDNENKLPEFHDINPKGKVPVLVVDGRVLTENVAIASYLDKRFPYAKLLPSTTDPLAYAENLSVLGWVAAGMHPMVTRVRRALRFCDLPGSDTRVPDLARPELAEQLMVAEEKLGKHPYILGEEWSIADVYLYWVWSRGIDEKFDTTPFPNMKAFAERMAARPSVQRALVKEAG
jgi:glutathione S-transferase